jgi:DNA ligase-4
VKVASLQKAGSRDIIHSSWLFDCIRQSEVDAGKVRLILPFEPR